jgi:hypothetical protein
MAACVFDCQKTKMASSLELLLQLLFLLCLHFVSSESLALNATSGAFIGVLSKNNTLLIQPPLHGEVVIVNYTELSTVKSELASTKSEVLVAKAELSMADSRLSSALRRIAALEELSSPISSTTTTSTTTTTTTTLSTTSPATSYGGDGSTYDVRTTN